MFYLTDDVRVRFKHFIEHDEGMKPTGSTKCTIEFREAYGNEDRWLRVHEGTAYCSPQDCFDRAIGRKVSLTRALEAIPSARQREEFWRAYFRWNGGF